MQKSQAEIDEERALQRQLEAVAWTDKELRKLIAQIKELGTCDNGQYTVAYGHLFVKTGNIFEALSGTLLTAKKQGVVAYEGQLLLQGAHDRVVVTLLKEEIADSTLETYMRKRPSGQAAAAAASAASHKGSAFGTESMKNAMLPCHICSKTVYPMEVGLCQIMTSGLIIIIHIFCCGAVCGRERQAISQELLPLHHVPKVFDAEQLQHH
jgi:hypothetical protein